MPATGDESHFEALHRAGALRAFVVSGLLLALPGGLLPLEGFHIRSEFGRAADYFLAVAAGLAAGGFLTQKLGDRVSVPRLIVAACFVGAAALAVLAFSAPPAPFEAGLAALALCGASAGALNAGTFWLIGPAWQADPARIALTGGIFFAAGSALASVLLAWCFNGANPPELVVTLAVVPAIAGVSMLLQRRRYAAVDQPPTVERGDRRSFLALLFALLLFFQFANEWTLAGWLPVFLIDRLGISPQSAVDLLALYWLALAAGRLAATRLLSVAPHAILLAAGAFCALFGCAALFDAGSPFGSVLGIVLAGMGFSAVYPLATEKISTRFTSYRPGYFNGIFTFALLGGMLAPCAVGYAAAEFGMRAAAVAPMIGSCAVALLLLVIGFGRKVSGA